MSRVRLAVVGAGHLGRIHARLASQLPEVHLAYVVDPCETARETTARETGATPIPHWRELVGAVDAAVVATPTSTHADTAGELLRAGVHCLVEKPITPTGVEADRLVQLARRSQTVLQVGHVERFNPAFESIRSHMADPKYIEARRHSGFTFRSTDVGVVLDLMIHDIDVVLSLTRSSVRQVDALGISVVGEHEDMVSARLQFESGAVAQLSASRVSYRPERTMQIFTSRRFASVDFADRQATLVEPTDGVLRRQFDAAQVPVGQRPAAAAGLFDELLVRTAPVADQSNAIEAELLDFAAAITTGRNPRVTGGDGRDAVAVAEQILQSVADHQWDGNEQGRLGPHAMPALPVLRAPQRPERPVAEDFPTPRRKAG